MLQKDYMWRIFEQFHVSEYNLAQTPLSNGSKLEKEEASKLKDCTIFHQMVGKLIYFTNIHLNILFTTNVISQYMSAPHKVHLEATKHMLYHIKGIQEFENFYEVGDNNGLHGFTNADWARNCEEQKSTSYIFQLSNKLIIWCSCKQLVVALSSIEAKYRTLTKGAKNQRSCGTFFKYMGCYKIKPLMFMSIIIVAL